MTATVVRPFSILVVCTGNICRSPLAEQLLTARLATSPTPFAVSSAGTMAQDGAPMDQMAATQSLALGGAPDGHRASFLTESVAERADLVLVAAREHRSAVVRLSPRVSRRTFTLEQFSRLAAAVDPAELAATDGPAAVVALVASMRGMLPPLDDVAGEDVVDPYRRSIEIHEAAAAAIDRTVDAVVLALTAPDRPGGE